MKNYEDYKTHCSKIADVAYSISILNWDQEVMMPKKSADRRAQQVATLAGILHELNVDKGFGNLLNILSKSDLNDEESRNIKETLKEYNRNKKYTTEFVQLMSKTTSKSFTAWQEAKAKNDFSIFAPLLEELVDLKRQECEIIGYKGHPYDAMLGLFEPNSNVSDLDELFTDVRNQLVPFVKEIAAAPQNKEDLFYQHFDQNKQLKFTEDLLIQMGYDFDAGRQDLSTHPFTTNFSATDVRVTTRVDANNLSEIMWSSIHEGGHALYEQGLKDKNYGLPSGAYLSLGIHESQSRLYENNVGRSLGYWKHNFPKLKNYFPEQLKDYNAEDYYQAMNIVKPSFIRTNADELTYHFHILIRYEIEKDLIAGNIEVKDLPKVWNAKYKEYLNIDVPNDGEGVLQDIHWSHGAFGYFSTYSIGSFYAAQFFNQAKKEIPELEKQIENGDLTPLLTFLRKNIHQHGKLFASEEICLNITGEKLNFKHFMDYAKNKYSKIYNLTPVTI